MVTEGTLFPMAEPEAPAAAKREPEVLDFDASIARLLNFLGHDAGCDGAIPCRCSIVAIRNARNAFEARKLAADPGPEPSPDPEEPPDLLGDGRFDE